MAPLVVLIGTGTSVGKTYVAERLLRALDAAGHAALAYKPVESGVTEGSDSDIARLERGSTFHVKPTLGTQTFSTPVSPHLAARLDGRTIDLELIRSEIQRGSATDARLFLVELPGGAFSPLTESVSAAKFARSLPGARALLVAVDRLGVLHDVAATALACAALGLPLSGIVLNAPEHTDRSVGTNASELPLITGVPVLARLPRAPADATVASGDPALGLARFLLGSTPEKTTPSPL